MHVEFHTEAEAEFIEEAAYLETRVPGLGERFISEIECGIARLQAHPEIGAPIGNGDRFRRLNLKRFPVSFIYTVDLGGLTVLAVAHQRREPGYWLNRDQT